MLKLIISVVITTADFDRLREAMMPNPAPICHHAYVSKIFLSHDFRWRDFHVASPY